MLMSFLGNIFSYIFCLFGYIKQENLYKEPLSKTEEEYYLRQYFKGDKAAKDKLIEHNLRLVAHIAKKYSKNNFDMEDFISIGTIGLIKAINSFKGDKGYKISTYASKCIDNEILMYIRSSKKNNAEISINSVIGTDKDGNDMELIDTLTNSEQDISESLYNKVITEQMLEYINNKLPEREKRIMNLRYGLDGGIPKTQNEVSIELNISRSYVSRIETKIQGLLSEFVLKE
ncbi:MAG: RNA polymerase sporulation sigma factor SigK [Clostridia bacterium]